MRIFQNRNKLVNPELATWLQHVPLQTEDTVQEVSTSISKQCTTTIWTNQISNVSPLNHTASLGVWLTMLVS